METIIISVVFLVIVALVIKYYTGKRKLPSDRSNTEKLANTLHCKFDKFIKDLNKGIKTPEDIQNDMLQTLEDFKYQKLNNIKQVVTNLVENAGRIKNNSANLINQKSIYTEKLDEMKSKVKNTQDEDEKSIYIKQGAQYIKQIDILNKCISQTFDASTNLEKQIDKIHDYTTEFISKVEIKKTEVLTMISSYISNDSSDFGIDISIDDLMNDYKIYMEVKTETNKIDKIAHSYVSNASESVPEETYIKQFKESIQ